MFVLDNSPCVVRLFNLEALTTVSFPGRTQLYFNPLLNVTHKRASLLNTCNTQGRSGSIDPPRVANMACSLEHDTTVRLVSAFPLFLPARYLVLSSPAVFHAIPPIVTRQPFRLVMCTEQCRIWGFTRALQQQASRQAARGRLREWVPGQSA